VSNSIVYLERTFWLILCSMHNLIVAEIKKLYTNTILSNYVTALRGLERGDLRVLMSSLEMLISIIFFISYLYRKFVFVGKYLCFQ